MPKRWAADERTLCEVLREINSMCQGCDKKDEAIRHKLSEAYTMAKRMNRKLYKYSRKWDRNWWEKNVDYAEIVEARMEEQFPLTKGKK